MSCNGALKGIYICVGIVYVKCIYRKLLAYIHLKHIYICTIPLCIPTQTGFDPFALGQGGSTNCREEVSWLLSIQWCEGCWQENLSSPRSSCMEEHTEFRLRWDCSGLARAWARSSAGDVHSDWRSCEGIGQWAEKLAMKFQWVPERASIFRAWKCGQI